MSRSPVAQTHTWLTPPDILAALGPFDLDPCACPEPRPWPTAATMWTREDQPLTRPWPADARVWLNPPFGPRPVLDGFLARMSDHGRGIALLFARTETETFARFVWDRATALLFLKGRPHFHRQDGSRASGNSGAPVVLAAYGRDDAERLQAAPLAGRRIALALALAVCAGLSGPLPGHAAPPPVGSEDWEIMAPYSEWIRGLQRGGVLCCTMADGRPVEARTRGDRWQVRWRPGQLEGAPTEWTDVPPDVVMHMPNPIGIPIAFWLNGQLRCFVPGTTY